MVAQFTKKLFPHSKLPNVKYFYIIHLLSQSFFISSVWLFFWLKFLNYETLGFINCIAFIIGWLAEIPSGILADRYGRKPVVVMAGILIAAGAILQTEATTPVVFCLSDSLYLIGFSFYSGAGEALLYDGLEKEKNRSVIYENVYTTAASTALIVDICATMIGAWLFQIDQKVPFYLSALTGLLISYFALRLKEDSPKHFLPIKSDSIEQKVSAFSLIFKLKLYSYLIIALAISGTYYSFSWGFIRPAMAMEFGLSEIGYSYALATSFIATFIILRMIPKIRTWISDSSAFLIFGLLLGISFITAAFLNSWWGAGLFIIMAMAGNGAPALMSIVVNQKIPGQYRATLISCISFAGKLPYIFVAWWGGILMNSNQSSSLYIILGSIGILLCILGVYLRNRCEVSALETRKPV